MPGFRRTRIWLSIILLAVTWRVAGNLVSHPSVGFGLVCALAGCLIPTFAGRSHSSRLFAISVVASVIVICGASSVILKHLAWRLHEVPVPDAIHKLASKVLPGTARASELITFWTGRHLETIRITFGALGIYEIWYLLVASMTFLGLSGARLTWRKLTLILGGLGLYALLRFIVLTGLAMEFSDPGILWKPHYVVVSWLPLGAVLGAGMYSGGMLRFRSARPGWAALVPVCAGIVLALGLGYEDPGNLKQGKLVIEETHADWEWVKEPFDTAAYGIRAEYNYYCLFEYLEHFYDVEVNLEPISPSVLDGADILMIKTPTKAFSPYEVEAIKRFVAAGGGLLLIGDHTNLFGMSTYLNAIAEGFGMRFRYDDTFDIETTGFSRYKKSRLCFHPCLREFREFEFLTSCSVQGDIHTKPVLAGYGLGSEDVDYSHPNFFGNMAFDICDRFGVFLQASARTFGKGRVLLFTDSTCFSNFCMFSPGATELILGFVDYLNRQGRCYPFVPPLAWVLLATLGLLMFRKLRRGDIGIVWVCLGLLIGSIVGVSGISYVNAALYGPLPRADVPHQLLFDVAHTDVSLFNHLGLLREPGVLGFEQLYLCTQRIGAHPYAGKLLDIQDRLPAGVILINPCTGFGEEELECLDGYLKGGGNLLILDGVLNKASTANAVLARYGIRLSLIPDATETSSDGTPDITPRLAISGGRPLGDYRDGNTEMVFCEVGRGRIVVATDSYRYSHHVLGPVLQRTRPAPPVRGVYREIYRLLQATLLTKGP
jgi:hypothetical protein